ncbi:Mediator of RNA polymerase II transcription subunit 17 [Fonsecaea pedrosoi]|nr:Mediator of RNA polymerase II transcription subunit 17 [Fonsecaea pedrosoi]
MSELDTISLLIPPEPSSKPHDLQAQIQQIIAQKGHFRHVTQSSLLAEIQGEATAPDAVQVDREDEPQAEDDTPQKRQERVWKRRDEMLERINYAQNEVLCALDFVSFLISRQSIPAQHSMSPALQQAVPVGTLASRVLKDRPIPPSTKRRLAAVSQGWRAEGFHSASQKLAAASGRLQTEAEREAEYWHQIADLNSRGWSVSRLPRDRKAIGVHFGFSESAPQFRDRGFALLRQGSDGSVVLDRQVGLKKRKRLGVYVVRDGIKTGAFDLQTTEPSGTTELDQSLNDYRNAIFEEELFYEICREARLVANQGITTRSQSVEVNVGGEYHLLLVSSSEEEDVTSPNAADNLTAQFVAISLRLLLIAAHEQNLIRRSQKPPPMTLKARPIPEYALLRPILAHLRHRAEAATFWDRCRALLGAFKRADLPISVSMEASNATVFQSLQMEPPNTMLAGLMVPVKTSFKIHLTAQRKLQIGLATFLGPALFGSRYEISSIDFGLATIASSHHETRDEALSFIRHILLLDLVAHSETLALEVQAATRSELDKSKQTEWAVSQPHDGELSLYDAQEAIEKLQISVQHESICVKLKPVGRRSGVQNLLWSWTSAGCSETEGGVTSVQPDFTFDGAIKQAIESSSHSSTT